MEKSKPRFCGGCGKELSFLSILSPVLENTLWNEVLHFFGLSEQKKYQNFLQWNHNIYALNVWRKHWGENCY